MHPHMPLVIYSEQGALQMLATLDDSTNVNTHRQSHSAIRLSMDTKIQTQAQTHMNWNGIDSIINSPLHN